MITIQQVKSTNLKQTHRLFLEINNNDWSIRNIPNMCIPSLAYNGLKKLSTNWTNHHVMKNVMATGNRTTLQFHHLSKSCIVGIEGLEIDLNGCR